MQWCKTTLGEICDKVGGVIQTGPFGSQLHESDYSQNGTPVVMPKDIIEGRIVTESIARISREHVERLSKHKLKPGDIVYGRRGDIGRQALIRKEQDEWLCGTGCLRLSLSDTIIEPLFLHFYLRQESVISWISNQAVGATLPNLNTGILRSVPVRVPPLPVQRRIAGILSAYDDLIENNQRRITILEKMARALYREWFVHFRFPGHEKVKMFPSPLGPIPHGWKVVTLKDVTSKIGSGATPRGGKEAYKTEGIRLIRSLNVHDYRFEFSGLAFIDEAQAAELDNVTVATKDILLNITGASVARCCMVPSYLMPARVNQHVAIVRTDPDRADSYYVLDTINSDKNKQQLLALGQGGATREALTKDTIGNFPIALPTRPLFDKYGKCAGAFHVQRETLASQTQNLRRTRDLLLPRLLSGHISLS